jgi:hypothetical protein
MGADGLLGDPLPAGNLALQLGGCSDGRRGSLRGPDDGDRGRPGTREGVGEKEEHEHGGLEEEVLVVAEQPWEGGVNRHPPKCGNGSGRQCSSEAGEDHQTLSVK